MAARCAARCSGVAGDLVTGRGSAGLSGRAAAQPPRVGSSSCCQSSRRSRAARNAAGRSMRSGQLDPRARMSASSRARIAVADHTAGSMPAAVSASRPRRGVLDRGRGSRGRAGRPGAAPAVASGPARRASADAVSVERSSSRRARAPLVSYSLRELKDNYPASPVGRHCPQPARSTGATPGDTQTAAARQQGCPVSHDHAGPPPPTQRPAAPATRESPSARRTRRLRRSWRA